ncbi:MAG: hypothetical protein KGJ78_09395 [Alphaproteobacteria bacterium]|nr:hypothetical protein [Alphaproteobacteria bacterium]
MTRTAPVSSVTPASGDQPFGFSDFLRLLDERRALIRNVTLAVVAVTAVVMMSLPIMYATSAEVMLDQRKNTVADLSSVLSSLPTDQPSVQNQIQMLTSRDLALRVIGKLKLYDDPEFNPALAGPSAISVVVGLVDPRQWFAADRRSSPDYERDTIISAFLNRLDVSALGLSTTINVTFSSRDPAKAALIANTLAQSYTRDQVRTKIEASRQAAQWLSERMRQLAQQVQNQEAAVEAYKTEHNLVESAQGNSLVDQQLVAINAQLVAARSDLAEKKAAYDGVQALMKSGNASDVSQIVASPLIVQLRTQQTELIREEGDLLTRYGPNHPKMQAIRAQKRDLEGKIAEEVRRISGSIANDLAVARAHVGSIQASLAQVEKQARVENVARIRLNALEADLASTRAMYESFVTRLRAVQDQDDIQIPEARVISEAPIPSGPSSPHRMLFIAASLPLGLLLGILAALLAERLQAPLPTGDMRGDRVPPAAAMRATAMPMAAMPAAMPAPLQTAWPPVLADLPASGALADGDAQGVEGRLLYQLLAQGGGRSVIALASPGPEPLRAALAVGLARLAARAGLRTILVDGDLAYPSLARALGYGAVPGFAAVLAGRAGLDRVLLRDRRSPALLLSAAPAAPAVWALPKMARLFDYFRRSCDLVIVDAGIAAPFPARLCDQTVIVASGDVTQDQLLWSLRGLAASGVRLAGLVVLRR